MHYGERGITVCERWQKSYDAFVEDMGLRPEGLTLERGDNDLGYTPENCYWASMADQCANRRSSRLLTHNGETQTVTWWAWKLGINRTTLQERLKTMSVEQALTNDDLRRK